MTHQAGQHSGFLECLDVATGIKGCVRQLRGTIPAGSPAGERACLELQYLRDERQQHTSAYACTALRVIRPHRRGTSRLAVLEPASQTEHLVVSPARVKGDFCDHIWRRIEGIGICVIELTPAGQGSDYSRGRLSGK